MKNKFMLMLALCFVAIAAKAVFADLESTNYKIADSYTSSGGGSAITSSSYALDEGIIDYLAKDLASSTNYSVEGKIGINGFDKIPVINSITPGNLSRFYTDESVSFSVSATSPDSDTLQYSAKQDGTTKAGPQASSTLQWALSASDKGRHVVTFNVIDPDGTVSKDQSAYVFRRPVK